MKRLALAGVALLGVLATVLQPWHDADSRPRPRNAPAPTTSPRSHTIFLTARSPSPVAIENERAGTRDWLIDPHPRDQQAIEGYADPVSATPGSEVRLFVRTKEQSVRADVYRLGWYGGTGARKVAVVGPVPGDRQTSCPVEGPRLTIECRWKPTLRIVTRADWVSGQYIVKLTDAKNDRAYVPFTLRELKPRAPILMVLGVTTWQAYNKWGGRNLYQGPANPAPCKAPCPTRSRAVSFDRPYLWPGAGLLFSGEFQAIEFLEKHGLDVGYATSIDLDRGVVGLDRRKVFLSFAHDEYYTTRMRKALEGAIAGGTSLAFIGANDMYRHMRFEQSPLGPDRIEVNYKFSNEDPVTLTDPSESTADWRRAPLNDPEQLLMGEQYECCAFRGGAFDWTPTGKPSWLFRGTGLVAGIPVPRLVQGEYDRVFVDVPRPAGVTFVARTAPLPFGKGEEQSSTIYVAPSGGAVFDAGDEFFACALGPTWIGWCGDRRVDTRIQRFTMNLIDGMLSRRFV